MNKPGMTTETVARKAIASAHIAGILDEEVSPLATILVKAWGILSRRMTEAKIP
jgi:hypothetical protein